MYEIAKWLVGNIQLAPGGERLPVGVELTLSLSRRGGNFVFRHSALVSPDRHLVSTSSPQSSMAAFPDLPIELISFIVDYLGDDREALRACALVSRVFVARSQAHLFRRVRLWNRRTAPIIRSLITDKTTAGGDVSAMQKNISPDPHGVLSYTRTLSVSLGTSARGRQGIEDIYDH